jgi:sensor domain CHASE-containing protein
MTMPTENEDTPRAVDNGSNSLKYLLTFLGGLVAGVALGLYLNSKQGKQIRKQVTQRMSALELEITDKVNAAMDEINNLAKKVSTTKTDKKESDNA